MEEDLLLEARRKHRKYREEKIEKRIVGEGDKKHLFVWTKRIVKILYENSRLTEEQIIDLLLKKYPEDYDSLPEREISISVRSILKSLLKKPNLKNIRGVNIDIIYGHGIVLKNNGPYWWIESLEERPETRMKKVLDIFKKKH